MSTSAATALGLALSALLGASCAGRLGQRAEVARTGEPFAAPEGVAPSGRLGVLWEQVLTGDYWEYSQAARQIVEMELAALDLLVGRLGDRRTESGQPVAVAQALIGQIARRVDLEEVLALAEHPEPVVRFEAARELERRRDPRAAPALSRLSGDPHPRVRQVAVKAATMLPRPEPQR